IAAALVPPAFRRDSHPRAFLPLATASAALLGVLSAGGFVWLVPALAAALLAVGVTPSRGDAVRAIAALGRLGVRLAVPPIVAAPSFLGQSVFTYDYLANLVAPLNPAQIAGIWPIGDFRYPTQHEAVTAVLIGVTVVAAVAGLLWAVRRKAWELPIYVAGA